MIKRTIIKCRHCGFPCVVGRDARADRGSRIGDGIHYEQITGISETKYDPQVKAGCPFCGTLLWDEGVDASDQDYEEV